MNIALIGGSGFVGTRLIELLKQYPYSLSNIDKNNSKLYPNITTIADIRNKDLLTTLLKGQDVVVLLAAEHRDDVSPTSLYYDVNVTGMINTLEAMAVNDIKRIIFTSSVAVYGLNKNNPDEEHPVDPFNHYGKSKWQAEQVLQDWSRSHSDWNINILRPTVIFGERNRGNVYNLLKQIAGSKFLMVGKGDNKKSMAYVGNVIAFIKFLIENVTSGYNVFNYIDKPDLSMNELATHVGISLNKKIPSVKIPYSLGMLGGFGFDLLAKITRKKFAVSRVRVKKFCATTQFDASKISTTKFESPFTLSEGLHRTILFEFVNKKENDDLIFVSE